MALIKRPPKAEPPPELIDDRAIERVDQDELRHAGFAAELAALVRAVPAPANVALFGSWGAGKSGLGKLLCGELEGKDGTRAVTYDAFKYADFPLRRHFISQIATSLGISDPAFHERLYAETTSTNVNLPVGKLGHVLWLFTLAALAGMGLFLGLAVLVSALLPGSFHSNFKPLVQSGPVLLVTPAALLAAFVALANKWIPIEHTRSVPSSEEEFERTFSKLITKSKAKKLVVFIDELDRCSPSDVVKTLESVRTFLDITGCVAVVAADQVVLERALSQASTQATPIHRRNPYYSAGSEYLDKVFQYQLPVPPLMPRRLSGFALRLLKGRSGIWTEVDHDRVVSVLIPIHVQSPRRVKTLLNAYATTYRVARKRFEEDVIHTHPRERAEEIAKLVCLRHEFPLFAAELEHEPDMPVHVLEIARLVRNGGDWEDERPGHVPVETWERAAAYAEGRAAVDVMLPDDTRSGADDGQAIAKARDRHSTQLIAYLQSTERVEGPRRDLIHLESGGAAFGLAPAFAERLESEAVAGASDDAAESILELDDNEQRRSALKLLASRSREAEVSGERRNTLIAMTSAAARLADEPEAKSESPTGSGNVES